MTSYEWDDELELVPERDFWERSSPYSLIPKPIRKYFFLIKKKFGMDVANIVLLAYKEWGKDVAVAMARRILEFDSYRDLIKFLQDRAKLLGEGRELVVNLIYSYQFSTEFQKLIEEKKRAACAEAAELMTTIFHTFARHGVFFPPHCVRQVAEYLSGCGKIQKRCKRTYDTYIKLTGGRKK